MIDSCTVVRLKWGLTPQMPREHFGTRTDYICASSLAYQRPGPPFWHFREDSPWREYFLKFKPRYWKPSNGLAAVFCAIDNLAIKEVALIGFDRILYPQDDSSRKWLDKDPAPNQWAHCQRAEHECLHSLGLKIIDLAKEGLNGEVSRL